MPSINATVLIEYADFSRAMPDKLERGLLDLHLEEDSFTLKLVLYKTPDTAQ